MIFLCTLISSHLAVSNVGTWFVLAPIAAGEEVDVAEAFLANDMPASVLNAVAEEVVAMQDVDVVQNLLAQKLLTTIAAAERAYAAVDVAVAKLAECKARDVPDNRSRTKRLRILDSRLRKATAAAAVASAEVAAAEAEAAAAGLPLAAGSV